MISSYNSTKYLQIETNQPNNKNLYKESEKFKNVFHKKRNLFLHAHNHF